MGYGVILPPTNGSIPGYIIFWVLFAIAFFLFVQRVYVLYRLVRMGRKENRFDRLVFRIFSMLRVALTQSSNLKSITFRDLAPIGHSLMFWGLGIFLIGYLIFIGLGAGFGLAPVINDSAFGTVFYSILDIVAALVIIAIVWTIIKRYIIKPERLNRKQTTEEKILQPIVLSVIIILMVLHYCIEGFGYAAYGISGSWPPIGSALANLISSGISQNEAAIVFRSVWWLNYILLLVGLIYAPRSKHLHPINSFPNMIFRNLGPKGALRPLDLKDTSNFGASKIQDFTWKQLLDVYACTICGRCHVNCPAQISGKPLSPRELILNLKEYLLEEGPELLKAKAKASAEVNPETKTDAKVIPSSSSHGEALIGKVISEDAIWACTTCRACQEVCPVNNEHIDKIIDFRRNLVMVSMSPIGKDTLKNMRVRGNPWLGTSYGRTDWAENLEIKVMSDDSNIDILYWVGCTAALEDRNLKVAQATAKLLKQSGVNFGILGNEESCCGEPARRLGNEYLFQVQAKKNIEIFKRYNVKKIITSCPHCFNTLKNEYPQFGGEFEVIHHTQYLADLLKNNKLKITPGNGEKITYHDPCYLGRYNDIYLPPRQVLNNIPNIRVTEMGKNRNHSFCCGGGGGRMWLEENIGERISGIRIEEAIKIQAQIVVTACPFCLLMFEDAIKAKEVAESMKVMDISELISSKLEPGKATDIK